MHKRKKNRRLSLKKDQRRALLRGLASALFLKERIVTTEAKAKELRGFAEKFITKAKKDNISTRRLLARYFHKNIVKKLVDELGPLFQGRRGGYTRIMRMSPRVADGAKMAIIELVEKSPVVSLKDARDKKEKISKNKKDKVKK